MGDTKVSQFEQIYLGSETSIGKLRLATSGIGWKASRGDKIITVPSSDLKKVFSIRVARNYQLLIYLKNGSKTYFDGFTKEDYEVLKDILKTNYKLSLEVKELSLRGWNWGETNFQGSELTFNVKDRPMFELDLNHIANTNLVGKNEVSIEFLTPEDAQLTAKENDKQQTKTALSAPGVDELVEMRFYIPNSTSVKKSADKETEGDEATPGNEDEEVLNPASEFYETIKSRADLQVTGEAICSFSEILLLTPRGRYDIDMFSTFVRLRGKTYDYKIMYPNITKLFLLPKPDDVHIMLVVGVNPPLRQGQTRYPYLVLQFQKNVEADLVINMDDETIAEKYEGKLQKRYEAPEYEVVSSLFRALSSRKVTIPTNFRSYHGTMALKCSMKANEGHLYPLDKCFVFVPKPAIYIPHSDIGSVLFSREEYKSIEEFLRQKSIKFKDELTEEVVSYQELDMLPSDDDEDEEGASSGLGTRKGHAGSEYDSEEDEDFVDDQSGSDIEEEYDENYSGSDSEELGTKPAKRARTQTKAKSSKPSTSKKASK